VADSVSQPIEPAAETAADSTSSLDASSAPSTDFIIVGTTAVKRARAKAVKSAMRRIPREGWSLQGVGTGKR